mmetsp:Transcript_79034/g.175133  ORF Transcript_79034/g.175133 Transcript_79034/m.175133 type:complete len:86 (+) Transcript_79034:3-260(+)
MMGYGRQLMRWVLEKARQKPRSECTRVTLCAMPDAIPFYERLHFTPIPEDQLEMPAESEDSSRRVPGALWLEYRCGRAYKAPGKR